MPVYPVQWLDSTFRSRSRTEELLRPDLESGLITEHDYNLARDFLPGYHRYYPFAYGTLTSTAWVLFGRHNRRWSFTNPRLVLSSFITGTMGATWGQIERAKAHLQFTKSLENPTGFAQALENVNRRTGGTEPLGWTVPGARRDIKPAGEGQEEAPSSDGGWVAADNSSQREGNILTSSPNIFVDPPTSNSSPGASQSSRPRSKWDEIREANARSSAQNSTWDHLRQAHERERIQNAASATSSSSPDFVLDTPVVVTPGGTSDEERRLEQARFDALLEAERRKAQG
ncbi:hypothetical protein K474DRAFT_1658343 [Panus rudis PR-1116 ss-1]|nr:hypothetical protein K474DRAFT_1658343 [Panus rudis PR-1116 ss-1]